MNEKYKRLKPSTECLLKLFEERYDLFQTYKIENNKIEIKYKDFKESPTCHNVNWLISQAKERDIRDLMKFNYISPCNFLENKDEIMTKVLDLQKIDHKNVWITSKGKQYKKMMEIKHDRRMNIFYPALMAIVSIASVITTIMTIVFRK
jgi:hypothetical protein